MVPDGCTSYQISRRAYLLMSVCKVSILLVYFYTFVSDTAFREDTMNSLPNIPVHPISYEDAEVFLRSVDLLNLSFDIYSSLLYSRSLANVVSQWLISRGADESVLSYLPCFCKPARNWILRGEPRPGCEWFSIFRNRMAEAQWLVLPPVVSSDLSHQPHLYVNWSDLRPH